MGELALEVLGEQWEGTRLAQGIREPGSNPGFATPIVWLQVNHFSLGLNLLCKMDTVIPTKKVVKTRGEAYRGAKLVSDTWQAFNNQQLSFLFLLGTYMLVSPVFVDISKTGTIS